MQPDSKNVIDSVTAESVCEIGRQVFGFAVERRRIAYEEIKEFSEVVAAGTAAALVPIRSITMRSRQEKFTFDCGVDGQSGGDIYVKLLQTLKGIQAGKVEDRLGWNLTVQKPPQDWLEGSE